MRDIRLSNFEFKDKMLKTLPAFWSVVYVESNAECLEDFESKLPSDSEFFTSIKSSPVKYKAFIDIIKNIDKRETNQ